MFLPSLAIAGSGTINQVTPQSIKPGDIITITGSGFGNTKGSSKICVGEGINCMYSSDIQSWSNGQIIAKAPSYITDGGTIHVTISNYAEGLFYTIDGSTVYVVPKLTSVTPTTVFQNQEITLSCGSLYSLSSCFGENQGGVLVGSQNASIKTWTKYSIVAYVPMSINPGFYNVTITNPGGDQSESVPITVLATPTIYNMNPNLVIPGVTNICLDGENFGTTEDNWSGNTANSQLTVGGLKIPKASWANKKICFDVPDTVKQSGYVVLKINGYQVTGYANLSFTIATTGSTAPPSYSGPSTKPNDTYLNKQWYLDTINAFSGWQKQSTSANVVVAVIDDGIYISHPDLQTNMWENTKEVVGNKKDNDGNSYKNDKYGWDFINNVADVQTLGGHGTHVAGIIGAVGNNNQGIAGISWKVKLMPLIACNSKGCPTSAVTKAIRYAADNGANVINLSLGSQGTSAYSDDYNEAIKYAYNRGVVIVAAAGNGDIEGMSLGNSGVGQDLGVIPQSPVCNDNGQNMVLGVGSTDDQGYRTRWSNYGSCADVYAPGKNIYSTAVPIFDGSYYSSEDGTSFSAPIVSGLAALLKGLYPSMPNSEIIARIIRNANKGVNDVAKTLQEPYTAQSQPVQNQPVTGQQNLTNSGTHQIGTNIKTSDGTISMVAPDGTRRPYTSAGAFLSYGFNSWGIVVDASPADQALPSGSFIPPRDGKIMCSDRGTDKGTCYLITGGAKAGFTSAKTYTGLGFIFSKSTKGDVSWMSTGENISDTQVAHRPGILVNDSGTYKLIVESGALGIPDASTLQSWGYGFGDAVPANSADKILAQTGVLQPRQSGELAPK